VIFSNISSLRKRLTRLLMHCNANSQSIYGIRFILDSGKKRTIPRKEKMSSIMKIYMTKSKEVGKNMHKVALKRMMEHKKKIMESRTITPSDCICYPNQQTRASSLESNKHGMGKLSTQGNLGRYRKDRLGVSLAGNEVHASYVTQFSSRSADRKRGKSPADYSLIINKNNAALSKSSNVSKLEELLLNKIAASNEYNTISYRLDPQSDFESKNTASDHKSNVMQLSNKPILSESQNKTMSEIRKPLLITEEEKQKISKIRMSIKSRKALNVFFYS
jgi:hypothetical protein